MNAIIETDKNFQGLIEYKDISWTKKDFKELLKVGDIIYVKKNREIFSLQQLPKINGGVVVMDPFTGRVLALSGGFSFRNIEFNRASQAMRQARISFQTFLFMHSHWKTNTPLIISFRCTISLRSRDRFKEMET